MELEAYVKRLEQCEESIKTLHSINNELNTRQVRVETKLDYIKDELKSVSQKIDKVIEQPSKRWDSIVQSLIAAGISAAITALFMTKAVH